jgi:hypothetical protein
MSGPDLVRCCVLMAVRARLDAARRALSAGERCRPGSGRCGRRAWCCRRPYQAEVAVLRMFSPATLNDDAALSPGRRGGRAAALLDKTAGRA